MNKTRQKWFPFLCQCKDCLEIFTVGGLVNGTKVIKLEEHRRIGRQNSNYYHRCGGNGHVKGRLMLYPVLKFWRS